MKEQLDMRRATLALALILASGFVSAWAVEPAPIGERKAEALERVDKLPNIVVRPARDTEAPGFTKTDVPGGQSAFVGADAVVRAADIVGAATNDMVTTLNVKSGAKAAVASGRLAVYLDGTLIAVPTATAQNDDVILLTGIPTAQAQALVKLLPAAKPAKPSPLLSVRSKQASIAPGGVLEVHAILEHVGDLRAFQVGIDAKTESGTALAIESILVDETHPEFAFMGNESVHAVDITRGRFVSALMRAPGVGVAKPVYTGTFRYVVPTDAKGPITVQIRTNVDTQLRDSFGGAIAFQTGEPLKVPVMAAATAQSK